MNIYKITLNSSSPAAMRDVEDVNQMHKSLSRLFSESDERVTSSDVQWRLEPVANKDGNPVVLVHCEAPPNFDRFTEKDWAVSIDGPVSTKRLLQVSKVGARLRFRLRANPIRRNEGKPFAIVDAKGQAGWLQKKAVAHGFRIDDLQITQSGLIRAKKGGANMFFNNALFEGILTVTDEAQFERAISGGIGRSKAFGFGMLSVAVI